MRASPNAPAPIFAREFGCAGTPSHEVLTILPDGARGFLVQKAKGAGETSYAYFRASRIWRVDFSYRGQKVAHFQATDATDATHASEAYIFDNRLQAGTVFVQT